MTLTWYDFLVLAILVFTTYRGATRGLVWQLAWIAALVLCFGFAETVSLQLAPAISKTFPQITPPLDRWIAMLILYMGFSFLSFGVARVLRGWIEKAKFVEYDRHLGGIFGLVKGVVVCLVMTFFVITLSASARETVLASKSGYGAAVIMNKLEPVMPSELAQILEPYMLQLDPNHTHELDDDDEIDLLGGDGVLLGNEGGPPDSDSGDGGFWDRITGGNRDSGAQSGQPELAGQGGTNSDADLRDFIRSLPTSMSRELQRSAVEAFRNATPAQRKALARQVESSLPDRIGQVLSDFNRFRNQFNNETTPGTENPPPVENRGTDPVALRNQTLTRISRLFSDRPTEQDRFKEQVNERLNGVPERVAVAVLADWEADLTASGTDPDPATDFKTKLDVRIYRQLASARVPLERLSRSLQQRMQNVARQ